MGLAAKKATLTLQVEFDREITDAESVADALDQLFGRLINKAELWSEYGPIRFGKFYLIHNDLGD